jgi:predicted Fe-S protein YdhL (DUF1289 family)
VTLIDRELFRFDADLGRGRAPERRVPRCRPKQLVRLTGAPVADVVQATDEDRGRRWARPATAGAPCPCRRPCINICRMDEPAGLVRGLPAHASDEIATWSRLDDAGKRAVWALPARARRPMAAPWPVTPPRRF